jgi:hypothetical protein
MKRILEVKKKIGNLSKNAKNPFFKSAYLDLTDLLNAVEPLLQEQGLILLQPIVNNEVRTGIFDSETGEEIAFSSIQLPDLKDPQKLGSCITYFRRYTLKSLLAIAEGDDDGNLASQPTPVKKPKLTDEQFKKTLLADSKQIQAVINKFDIDTDKLELLKAKL